VLFTVLTFLYGFKFFGLFHFAGKRLCLTLRKRLLIFIPAVVSFERMEEEGEEPRGLRGVVRCPLCKELLPRDEQQLHRAWCNEEGNNVTGSLCVFCNKRFKYLTDHQRNSKEHQRKVAEANNALRLSAAQTANTQPHVAPNIPSTNAEGSDPMETRRDESSTGLRQVKSIPLYDESLKEDECQYATHSTAAFLSLIHELEISEEKALQFVKFFLRKDIKPEEVASSNRIGVASLI